MACPRAEACAFHQAVEPSIIKRVKYANVYAYCRGGDHGKCALYSKMEAGLPVATNLMPDGTIGDYTDTGVVARRFLIIEDAPIFAALASSTIADHFQGSEIVRRTSYETAADDLRSSTFSAIVCGFGLGGDKTVHDVRRVTSAPIVVLTGRLGHIDAPYGSQVVAKGAGPEALASALRSVMV